MIEWRQALEMQINERKIQKQQENELKKVQDRRDEENYKKHLDEQQRRVQIEDRKIKKLIEEPTPSNIILLIMYDSI